EFPQCGRGAPRRDSDWSEPEQNNRRTECASHIEEGVITREFPQCGRGAPRRDSDWSEPEQNNRRTECASHIEEGVITREFPQCGRGAPRRDSDWSEPEQNNRRPSAKLRGATECASHIEEKVRSLRLRLGIPVDAIVIGSVGRLSPEKNYSLLVRSFARLAQGETVDPRPETLDQSDMSAGILEAEALGGRTSCEPSLVHGSDKPRPPKEQSASDVGRSNVYGLRSKVSPFLLLVGDGPDRVNIEAEITRLNLKDRCMITGIQTEVLPWLQAMDIFCLSSDTEGLSISLLEAGACGLPSVVTDAGGNREIIRDGVSGVVVPIGDEVALAVGFERLVGDVTMRQAMGSAARKIVEERFSLQAMVDGYVKVYERAMKRDS
ncbi:MAG: glycosyltransferase, partial [bacterium]